MVVFLRPGMLPGMAWDQWVGDSGWVGGMVASVDPEDGWEDPWPILEILSGPRFFPSP